MTSVPIIESDGTAVARLEWTGTLYQGEGRVVAEKGHADRRKQIEGILAQSRYLEGARFQSTGSRATVKGWQGFEGTLNCLLLGLPALGLTADVAAVEWPKE